MTLLWILFMIVFILQHSEWKCISVDTVLYKKDFELGYRLFLLHVKHTFNLSFFPLMNCRGRHHVAFFALKPKLFITKGMV